jgi:IAA-amino acid hydrolase
MLQRARELHERIRDWRRMLHEYPELGYQEERTAGLIAGTLRELGLSVQTGVARTGVIGTLGSGDRPTVALRADIDALPIQEENDVPYASKLPGRMHACGHDAHAAMLLGAATLLAENPPPGRIRFLFQPSEEGPDSEGKSGGRRFREEGALEGVDAVFGQHVSSEHELGTVAVRPGPLLASADLFDLEIMGRGCHGAYPHKGVDPILLSAHVILALQQIVSRRIDPLEPGVVTVGSIEAGSKHNIIPERALLKGTIRAFNPEVRQQILEQLPKACSVAQALGGDYRLTIIPSYPPTVNEPTMTSLVREVASAMLGPHHVQDAVPRMGAEDFSYLAQAAPGCFWWLGVRTPGQPERHGHSPVFDIDEDALPIGAALLAEVADRFLRQHKPA